jgi:hypothetical protein
MNAALSRLFHDEWFRSIVTILIGFLISQLTGYRAERKERKKAVSCALSDLLMVKHQLFGLEDIIEKLGSTLGNIPEHEKSHLRVVFNSLLPKWEDLHARYDQSITTLAGLHPLLAFELRSKDYILPSLNWMHSAMANDPQAAALIGPLFKTMLLGKIEPVLNKSLVGLARRKSLICWYETRRLVKRKSKLSDEFAELLEPVKTVIEAQRKAAVSAQTPAGNNQGSVKV